MSERRWTISSVLSASRVVLLVPLVYCLVGDVSNGRMWAVLILLVGVATDFFDGYFARRLHQVTEFGKVVDPLADKIAVAVIFIVLAWLGDIELWLVVLIILRDLLLLAGAVYIRRIKGITVQSNWPGKVAVSAMAVLALLSLLNVESLLWLRDLTLWFTVFMIVLSSGMYAQRLFIGRRHQA